MKIRFATDLLKRLGEELNPSVDRGLIELVKNSYDADATECIIELKNIGEPGGQVTVQDNGMGMDAKGIEHGWLVLGSSEKEQSRRTPLGRIPAGNKGLGRLAALRMGRQVLLTTRPKSKPCCEYGLLIDWDEYEGVNLVDDVALSLQESSICVDAESGTEIIIDNLRSGISRRELERLARELILLAGPFEDDPESFKPVLKTSEYSELEKLVRCRYFDEADFHLIAGIDNAGMARARVEDGRGGILFDTKSGDENSPFEFFYPLPPMCFELWNFVMGKGKYQPHRSPDVHIKNWLKAFGGVHIYQNGLRVTPYGDPGNDWLDMNLSRVRSPEERPSTNNSIGKVVFEDQKGLLVQKTDRSGFIETDVFRDMREFCQTALDWMAARRLEEAEKRRQREREESQQKTEKTWAKLAKAIEGVPGKQQPAVKKALESARVAVEKRFVQLESEIQLYRTLSTAGITAATFAHESAGNPVKVIKQASATLKRRITQYANKECKNQVTGPIELLDKGTQSLSVLGDATLSLLAHEKRRMARVDIHDVINQVLDTFMPFLEARQISVVGPVLCGGNPYLRGSRAAIESILTNLLNNSIVALEGISNRDRQIAIMTTRTEGAIYLSVSDSGPGIRGIATREIWLPGRTTRPNGTGLGLTIVQDTAKDLGGEVSCAETSELGGAEITVSLPILGT